MRYVLGMLLSRVGGGGRGGGNKMYHLCGLGCVRPLSLSFMVSRRTIFYLPVWLQQRNNNGIPGRIGLTFFLLQVNANWCWFGAFHPFPHSLIDTSVRCTNIDLTPEKIPLFCPKETMA